VPRCAWPGRWGAYGQYQPDRQTWRMMPVASSWEWQHLRGVPAAPFPPTACLSLTIQVLPSVHVASRTSDSGHRDRRSGSSSEVISAIPVRIICKVKVPHLWPLFLSLHLCQGQHILVMCCRNIRNPRADFINIEVPFAGRGWSRWHDVVSASTPDGARLLSGCAQVHPAVPIPNNPQCEGW
jgi:hypothetical protein